MKDKLKLHFTGKNIEPSKIRVGKLAEILESIEELIAVVASQNHPDLSKDNLTISLLEIESGSLGLSFDSYIPEVVNPAFTEVAEAIHGHIQSLPDAAYVPLEKILRFLRQNEAQADFIISNDRENILTTLTSDYVLPKPSLLAGETTVYGEIVRVGGVEPKVEVKSISGDTLYCIFEKELASQLGARLYQVVGLHGQAKWNSRTREIVEFKVTSLSEYTGAPVTESFKHLARLAGKYYEDITDVDDYIAHLRGGT